MTSAKRLRAWLLLGVTGIGATGAVGADFNCCRAPRCWQYHRNECLGHYPTRWRSWDEVCGAHVQPSPTATASTISPLAGVVAPHRIPAVGPAAAVPAKQNPTATSSKTPEGAARSGDARSKPPAVVQLMAKVNTGGKENPIIPPMLPK